MWLTHAAMLAAAVQIASPPLAPPPLVVEISVASVDLRAGDEIPIAFTIQNVGATTYHYTYRTYDRSGRIPEYSLEAFDARGRRVPDPRTLASVPKGYIGGGLGSISELRPGERFTHTVALNLWALVTAPGQYTIRGRYSVANGVRLESQVLTIRILPRTPDESRVHIDALAAELTRTHDPGLRVRLVQRLMFTADPRAADVLRTVADENANVRFWISEAFAYYFR